MPASRTTQLTCSCSCNTEKCHCFIVFTFPEKFCFSANNNIWCLPMEGSARWHSCSSLGNCILKNHVLKSLASSRSRVKVNLMEQNDLHSKWHCDTDRRNEILQCFRELQYVLELRTNKLMVFTRCRACQSRLWQNKSKVISDHNLILVFVCMFCSGLWCVRTSGDWLCCTTCTRLVKSLDVCWLDTSQIGMSHVL